MSEETKQAYSYIVMNSIFMMIYLINAILVYKRFKHLMDRLAKLNILIFIIAFLSKLQVSLPYLKLSCLTGLSKQWRIPRILVQLSVPVSRSLTSSLSALSS